MEINGKSREDETSDPTGLFNQKETKAEMSLDSYVKYLQGTTEPSDSATNKTEQLIEEHQLVKINQANCLQDNEEVMENSIAVDETKVKLEESERVIEEIDFDNKLENENEKLNDKEIKQLENQKESAEGTRLDGVSAISNEYKLMLTKLELKDLLIPKRSHNLQVNTLAIITAAVVANDENLQDTNAQTILSLYFGIFNIYLEFMDIPAIIYNLPDHDYRLNEVSVEEWTSWIALKSNGVSQTVAIFLQENDDQIFKLAWTLLGPLLCLLGHRPNKSNIVYWGNKMISTYHKTTNLDKDKNEVLFYPTLKFCKTLAKLLEEMYEIKRNLFYLVYNTASSFPRLPGIICRLTIELLRGVGLIDFILIDKFLLVQNPFALLLNSITIYASILLEAYEKYMEFGHLAPWCTIIAAPANLEIFKRQELKYVAAIARGLAIRQGINSLKSYQPLKETYEIRCAIQKAYQLFKEITKRTNTNNNNANNDNINNNINNNDADG